ncbi:MAG: RNA 2',3'-cyclic phosphodiesterase [Planctomycetota bacterium]
MRIFVAVSLDAAARSEIRDWIATMRPLGSPSIRWVEPAGLHVTISFLGEVKPAQIEIAREAIESAARSLQAFDLELAGIGTFPSQGRLRVIWIGCGRGTRQLTGLHECIGESLAAAGFQPDRSRFQPHVTVGRVKGPIDERVQATLSDATFCATDPVRVSCVKLLESQLHADGPRYSELATIQLSPPTH